MILSRIGLASPLVRASSTIRPPQVLLRSVASLSSLVDFGNLHVTKGLPKLVNGIVKSGKGSYVQMEDGRQFLDFTCGIGVVNLGVNRVIEI
jgi:4-aminobutyrate aminotransferase-like enzyme